MKTEKIQIVRRIQMVFMPENQTYMFLTEIHFETNTTGKIRFNANPVALRREERFEIDNESGMTLFENFHVPTAYIHKWLNDNNCISDTHIQDIGFKELHNKN